MDAQAIMTISGAVVALTELFKFFKMVPDRYGPLSVFILSALGVVLFQASQPEPFVRTMLFGVFAGWIVVATAAAGVYGFVKASQPEQVTTMRNTPKNDGGMSGMASVLIMGLALFGAGCAGVMRAPELVAQAGEATAISIGTLQTSIASLTKTSTNPQGVIPADVALRAQTGLLTVNTSLKPLPDILRAIDLAQKTGNPDASLIQQALSILQAVSGDLSIVVAGIPVNDATKQILDAVVAGQRTVTTLLIQLGRLSAGVKMPAAIVSDGWLIGVHEMPKTLMETWERAPFRLVADLWLEEYADRIVAAEAVY